MMDRPSFITDEHWRALLQNGQRSASGEENEPAPIIKLVDGTGAAWLLTEIVPSQPDLAFGLCDLGLGYPELGYVSLAEITEVSGQLGLRVQCDSHFQSIEGLSIHAAKARTSGRIVT